MKNAIEINNLTKKYDNFTLNNINLVIPTGTIVGLIGENGAGKSTLIKSILNIIKIDNGSIKIFNQDHLKNENIIKEDIGVVLDNSFFTEYLTPTHINSIMQNIYQKWDSTYYFKELQKFNIPTTKILKEFSKGMKKKLEIITCLSHHPKLLILDEPTSGLDPIIRSDVLDMFLEFVKIKDHTILFSSHITSDIEHTADYIIFINNGEIIMHKKREEIINDYGLITCSHETFKKIEANDIIRFYKNRHDYQILIQDKEKFNQKYPNVNINKINLEDLMVLIIKGETIK